MKVGGYILLLASFAFGLYVYKPVRFDPGANPGEQIVPVLPTAAPITPAEPARRSFAIADPRPVLKSIGERAAERLARAPDGKTPAVAMADAGIAATPPDGTTALAAAADKIASQETATTEETQVKGRLTSVTPADDSSRDRLVRGIKRELRRVGCYDGQLDGDWDRGSKEAMGIFMDRVNATLPYHDPDYVLLNLVRGHKSLACGATCPKGQALNGEGRCLPNAIIAKSAKKSAQPQQVASAERAKGSTAPKTAKAAVTQPGASHQATVKPSPQLPAGDVRVAQRPPPLPGRMAMGGPGSGSSDGSSGSWWDNLVGAGDTAVPKPPQTLDAPVGLTRVPEPRLATRPASGAAAPVQTAAVAPAVVEVPVIEVQGPGATQLAPAARMQRRASRPSRGYRSRPPRAYAARPPERYAAKRWRGRNVQMMFQHPLGRM